MSQTTTQPVIVSPATNAAISLSQTGQDLVSAAEQNPVVKADFQTIFVSYSHNPIVMGLVPIIGGLLTQEHVTVDSTLLTVLIGLAVTGLGYAWQWASMKFHK